eukprot:COSAG03_NODE_2372_length_2831_cov_4.732796_3_plen_162_part_00
MHRPLRGRPRDNTRSDTISHVGVALTIRYRRVKRSSSSLHGRGRSKPSELSILLRRGRRTSFYRASSRKVARNKRCRTGADSENLPCGEPFPHLEPDRTASVALSTLRQCPRHEDLPRMTHAASLEWRAQVESLLYEHLREFEALGERSPRPASVAQRSLL